MLMTAPIYHVRTVEHVSTQSMLTSVAVHRDTQEQIVNQASGHQNYTRMLN